MKYTLTVDKIIKYLKKILVNKADYNLWKECTEVRFKEWNEKNIQYSSVDEMAEEFMEIYTECMIEAVPKKEIKRTNRRKKPPWWNDKVSEIKQELNKAKKDFRKCKTPNNFHRTTYEAKAEWTKLICNKITYDNSAKEMWENFNYLTTHQNNSGGGGGGATTFRQKWRGGI